MRWQVDVGSLLAGIGIVALGVLILLGESGDVQIEAGWLIPAGVAVTGLILVASGIAARGPRD